jgi:DNA processing protein
MPRRPEDAGPRACDACLRRTHLVELLAPHVEKARHGRPLPQILALGDDDLLAAVAGRRRSWFERALEAFAADVARERVARAGLVALCVHANAYPGQLAAADDRPAVLFLAGAPTALPTDAPGGAQPAVAVVGARRATPYGLEVARSLGRGLAAAGITVVSGMALGVDSAAHAGAVEAGGPTVAVLAGGADRPYPASKAGLYRRIVGAGGPAAGCVVSEMPPGYVPFKWGFPARNRIIAGLAEATIVVEAAVRSGSLITAELAQDIGRLVAAVPGPVTSPMSAGANALLRDGAEVVRDAQDVLDSVLGPGVATLRAPAPPDLDPALRTVLDRLGARPATPAALLRPGDDVDATLAALADLELRGLARRAHGGAYVRALAT